MHYNFDSNLTKRISFILSTKNRSTYLQKALEQSSKLVGPGDELIVIDGGSTDGTQEIIKKFSSLVNIFVSEPDQSEGHGFNKGILLANGKYIKPLTDDDTFYPEAIDHAVSLMDNNPDIDLLITGGIKNKNGTEYVVYMREGSDFGKNVESLYRNNWCGIGFLIRRSSLSKAGIFNAESTQSFTVDMNFDGAFSNNKEDISDLVDENEWIRTSFGPFGIDKNENKVIGLPVRAPRKIIGGGKTPTGTYIFRVEVKKGDGNRYGNIQKVYIEVT